MSAQTRFAWSPISDPSVTGFILLPRIHFPITAFLLIFQGFFLSCYLLLPYVFETENGSKQLRIIILLAYYLYSGTHQKKKIRSQHW